MAYINVGFIKCFANPYKCDVGQTWSNDGSRAARGSLEPLVQFTEGNIRVSSLFHKWIEYKMPAVWDSTCSPHLFVALAALMFRRFDHPWHMT